MTIIKTALASFLLFLFGLFAFLWISENLNLGTMVARSLHSSNTYYQITELRVRCCITGKHKAEKLTQIFQTALISAKRDSPNVETRNARTVSLLHTIIDQGLNINSEILFPDGSLRLLFYPIIDSDPYMFHMLLDLGADPCLVIIDRDNFGPDDGGNALEIVNFISEALEGTEREIANSEIRATLEARGCANIK